MYAPILFHIPKVNGISLSVFALSSRYGRFASNHTSSSLNEDIPVIKIPKYLKQNLGNQIAREHHKIKKRATIKKLFNKETEQKDRIVHDHEHANKLIISSSGDKRLNHYYGREYNPEKLPLISKEWLNRKSLG